MAVSPERELEHQQVLTIMRERERLARELHDNLGQTLGFVNTQAQSIRALLAQGQLNQADRQLARLINVIQDTQTDIGEFIFGVQSSVSHDMFGALEQYLQHLEQYHGLNTTLDLPSEARIVLAPMTEAQLVRIIQEALTNVRKHAHTNNARVSFALTGDRLCVTIEDDGCGFVMAQLKSSGGLRYGLRSMRDRAKEFGGRLEIKSIPLEGTRVTVWIPLSADRELISREHSAG